jgi:hypothetical protein
MIAAHLGEHGSFMIILLRDLPRIYQFPVSNISGVAREQPLYPGSVSLVGGAARGRQNMVS